MLRSASFFTFGKYVNSFFSFLFVTFCIAPKVFLFSLSEERKVRKKFYGQVHFAKLDRWLKKLYRFHNPYVICKRFLRSRRAAFEDAYGETPLTVFHDMFLRGELNSQDCFVDLGCGRGRGVLFASSVWNVRALGVEQIPFFCEQAKKLVSLGANKAQFFCQEISSFPMSLGSFFYFYGLCLEEEELLRSCKALEKIPLHAKLVTVSFPITEYSSNFSLLSSWEAVYPWGVTKLFLHQRK